MLKFSILAALICVQTPASGFKKHDYVWLLGLYVTFVCVLTKSNLLDCIHAIIFCEGVAGSWYSPINVTSNLPLSQSV